MQLSTCVRIFEYLKQRLNLKTFKSLFFFSLTNEKYNVKLQTSGKS